MSCYHVSQAKPWYHFEFKWQNEDYTLKALLFQFQIFTHYKGVVIYYQDGWVGKLRPGGGGVGVEVFFPLKERG